MLFLTILFVFLSIFCFILGIMPLKWDNRPTLQLNVAQAPFTGLEQPLTVKKKPGLGDFLRKIAGLINKPLAISPLGKRMARDISMAKLSITVEEFFLLKEVLIVALVWLALGFTENKDFIIFFALIGFALGYMLPEIFVKIRMKKVKDSILKDLPDTVDLLGLCVNAGLDFMMALKYVVDKSHASVIIDELRAMMQEINVGKPRRDALRDLARKYEMPDLSTFSRTLIQADRMGTSVSEALNILSEDMREARFRRGEAMALKAPLKMLIPLLFFIFPVVAILVAGPILLDFLLNNPLQSLGK